MPSKSFIFAAFGLEGGSNDALSTRDSNDTQNMGTGFVIFVFEFGVGRKRV